MSSSRRMSFSMGGSRPLMDGASVSNARSSSSSSRRMSLMPSVGEDNSMFGGGVSKLLPSETPMKDRRAKLEDWRRRTAAREQEQQLGGGAVGESGSVHGASSIGGVTSTNHYPQAPPSKRARHNHHAVQETLPPAFSASAAVERLRKQRAEQQRMAAAANCSNLDESVLSDYDEDDSYSYYSASSKLLQKSILAPNSALRAAPSRRRSIMPTGLSQASDLTLSQNSVGTTATSRPNATMNHSGGNGSEMDEATSDGKPDAVQEADLKSRLREMQYRIDQLEKEKMMLSIDKAPLEARFRQKEEEWLKNDRRMMAEIDELKKTCRETNETNRDLQLQLEALEETNRQLRLQVRKVAAATTTVNHDAQGDNARRQHELDRTVEEIKTNLRYAEEEIKLTRLDKLSVEKELHATKIELEALSRDHEDLVMSYDEMASSTSQNRDAEIQLEHLTTEHIATAAQLNAVCTDLAATRARAEAEKQALQDEHKQELDRLLFDMSVLKARATADANKAFADANGADNDNDVAILKARIEERERKIAELEKALLKGEEQRRQMHNQIQELRGNIRVFVRTRPFLPNDGGNTDSAIEVSPDGESLAMTDMRTSNEHAFKFDKVFPPSSGQDAVFAEVSDFVQSALDGYHVCLFSYGQTGSGKTHTMQGSGNGVMRGIIPRAVEQILQQVMTLRTQRWDFRLSASFLEIYNEELKDLLYTMAVSAQKNTKTIAVAPKLAIKRSREGKSFVDGLTEIPIETLGTVRGMEQLDALMGVAARARSVASTKMNAQSSRSHSVFMLHLRGFNDETGTSVHGALNLCDLAGSERLDRSGAGADAQRLKETQAINKSLSCLGDVFNALSQRASHVPYRNSKLTYLLQDCLSGDGKALMFVNLSPTLESSNESLCSLRFAQRVNQVELGKPTKHVQYASASSSRSNKS